MNSSHSLFAFGFASPFLLWGLALGGLPILIHLLNKRKFRETQWAAMRFLLEAVRKNSRRIRVEQLVLLAVRTLLLCLLVMALARPHFAELGRYFSADVPTHRIIAIDASYSMAYDTAAQSRFQQAQAIARQIVEDARQGDALNLVRIAGSEPRVVVSQPAFQPAEVIDEIDQLKLPHERGDVFPTLREIYQLLQAAPEVPAKEVYLISDFQRASWTPDAAGKPAEIRELLRSIGEKARLVILDVGQSGSGNSAVTGFEAADPFITAGRPSRFKVAATTFGTAPVVGQNLELIVDGRLQEQRPVSLQPATETVEFFTHTFSAGGEHRVEVRLPKDALAIDDARRLTVAVKEEIRVLCVNGKLAGTPRDNATYHLEIALDPSGRDAVGKSLVKPRVIKYGEFRGTDLGDYDCVFLCNISSFDAAEVQLLEAYLEGGGGVVWCLGDRVRPEEYNRLLYRDGRGILPARIRDRVGDAAKREQVYNFEPREFAHAIVKVFQGNPNAGLETTPTYEYFKTSLPDEGRTRVVLAFDTGDPALLETSVGAGRSVLVTTAVDESWGNWALWPSFVPLVQEMVIFAISGRARERELAVSEPLTRTVQTRGADVSATVTRPDGESEPLRVTPGATLSSLTYDRTDISGFYAVEFGPPVSRTELFAVNVDTRESNLAKLDRDELDRELLPGTPFVYRTEWAETQRRATAVASDRGGLTRWLLYATLYLLFVELVMAWNFSYGLWLLFPPLIPLALLTGRTRATAR